MKPGSELKYVITCAVFGLLAWVAFTLNPGAGIGVAVALILSVILDIEHHILQAIKDNHGKE